MISCGRGTSENERHRLSSTAVSTAPSITDRIREGDSYDSPVGDASFDNTRRHQTSLARIIVAGMGLAGALHVSSVAVNFSLTVVVARVLSADDFGIYALSISNAQLLATLIGLGFPFAIIRFFPQYVAMNQFGQARGVARRLAMATYVSSAVFAVGGMLIVVVVSQLTVLEYRSVQLITILLAALLCVANYQLELARANKRLFAAYFPSRVAWAGTVLVALGVLYLSNARLGAATVLIVSAAILLVLLIGQHRFIWSKIQQTLGNLAPIYETRYWFRVALPLWFTTLGTTILSTSDVLMVGMLAGTQPAAIYFAAKKLASLVGFALLASNSIVAPLISEHFHANRRDSLESTLSYAAWLVFFPALLSAIALLSGGEFALQLFGETFISAWPALIVLVLGQLIDSSTGAVGYLVVLTGHQKVSAIIVTGAAALQVSLGLLLIPKLGVFGALDRECSLVSRLEYLPGIVCLAPPALRSNDLERRTLEET